MLQRKLHDYHLQIMWAENHEDIDISQVNIQPSETYTGKLIRKLAD